MIASFFNTSNNWFSYTSNFFFAAAGFGTVARFIYKLIVKHSDSKIDKLTEDLDEKFEEILSQYRPNGGSTNKDQMNRIESRVEELKEGQDILHQRIDNIKEDFAEHKGYHKGLADGE
jgi:gas vesicle protein